MSAAAIPRWKIYYADGSTFCDLDGPPEAAPALGVIVIAMPDADVGRILVDRFDFYIWRDGEWYGSEIFGLFDALQNHPGCVVRFGRTVSNTRYQEIHAQAVADDYLPVKSSRLARERTP